MVKEERYIHGMEASDGSGNNKRPFY